MDTDEDQIQAARNRALYAMRRPQDFTPWEEAAPNGWELSRAIYALTLPDDYWRQKVQNHLADKDVGLTPERWVAEQNLLWQHIHWRLQQGQLFMRGLELTTGVEWHSEPRMFDDAEPDFARNRITCFGRTFASIRVHETSQASGEKLATAWMLQNVTTYVANQRDDRVSDCMAAVGVRRAEAIAGWMALPELIRGRNRLAR